MSAAVWSTAQLVRLAASPLRWAGRALRLHTWAATLLVLLGLAPAAPAQAHLMVAQRGTLNLVNGGGFMVLSLPVSAFAGSDDNADGLLSPQELQRHEQAITQRVLQGAQLLHAGQALPLQGVLLQLSPTDHEHGGAAQQLIVMGRFALPQAGPGVQATALRFKLSLYGRGSDEQAQQVTVSRGDETQRLLLAPGRDQAAVMPAGWQIFSDHLSQGLSHVLGGLDHLLFLLVVLASGWGLRRALWSLSCFTLGHAITLSASALGGLAVASSVIEPAIAASIVAMALFDRWLNRQPARHSSRWVEPLRLGLVFGFALVHGLGLAGALNDLGLDLGHRLWSLAGFNLGVELAQIGVALLAAVAVAALHRWPAAAASAALSARLHRLASGAAVAVASVWFLQRVTGLT